MNARSTAAAAATALAALVISNAAVRAGEITVLVDGSAVSFAQPPVQRGSRVYVPLRGVFERLGASVKYAGAGKIVARTTRSTIELTIGSRRAVVDGRPRTLDAAPFVVASRTLVPLRFVSESLGANVRWQQRTISIESGPGTPTPPTPPTPAVSTPTPTPTPTPRGAASPSVTTPAPSSTHKAIPPTSAYWNTARNKVRLKPEGQDLYGTQFGSTFYDCHVKNGSHVMIVLRADDDVQPLSMPCSATPGILDTISIPRLPPGRILQGPAGVQGPGRLTTGGTPSPTPAVRHPRRAQ